MSINASFSEVLNFLGKILVFFQVDPFGSLLAVVAAVVLVIALAYLLAYLRRNFFKSSVEDDEGGKRRKTKKKSYWLTAGCIGLIILAIWVAIWVLGFVILEKEDTDTKKSATDSSSSSSEGTEESSSVSGGEKSHYVVIQADISWSDAEKACEDDGGHLATITSREEYTQVIDVLESYIQENGSSAENIFYVWLGGWNEDSDSKRGINNYEWITGEEWDHDEIDFFWCNTVSDNGTQISEPSFIDENTGDIENRLVLWKHEMSVLWNQEPVILNWTFSDQNDDFLTLPDVSSIVKGRIAYICEYED
ncbi:MAG: hypothetical protein LUG58_06645 [Clostridiales bacterium]|nr:hypothetical protein [Clostridiales bacterium]